MIYTKNIINDSHKDLRKRSLPVNMPMSEEDKTTLIEMYEYLLMGYDDKLREKYKIKAGVGLAAPQIHVLKQMFAICAFDEEGNEHSYLVINPKIVQESVQLTYLEGGEGCLSVPRKVEGLVHRPQNIKVLCALLDYETREVKENQELNLSGYISIVFQHENDHLKGMLFYDHINKINPFFVPETSTPVRFNHED